MVTGNCYIYLAFFSISFQLKHLENDETTHTKIEKQSEVINVVYYS